MAANSSGSKPSVAIAQSPAAFSCRFYCVLVHLLSAYATAHSFPQLKINWRAYFLLLFCCQLQKNGNVNGPYGME